MRVCVTEWLLVKILKPMHWYHHQHVTWLHLEAKKNHQHSNFSPSVHSNVKESRTLKKSIIFYTIYFLISIYHPFLQICIKKNYLNFYFFESSFTNFFSCLFVMFSSSIIRNSKNFYISAAKTSRLTIKIIMMINSDVFTELLHFIFRKDRCTLTTQPNCFSLKKTRWRFNRCTAANYSQPKRNLC